MNGDEVLIAMECDLARVRIRIAELEFQVMREHAAQRQAASIARRRQIEAAAAVVKQLEDDVAREAEQKSKESAVANVAPAVAAAAAQDLLPADSATPRPNVPAGLSRVEPVRQRTASPVNVQETWPDGTTLDQPRTFGLKPPLTDLEPNGASPDEYHRRLTQHLAFATKVLHTSGVVAVVWREWRTFERLVQDRLRAVNAAPPVYTP